MQHTFRNQITSALECMTHTIATTRPKAAAVVLLCSSGPGVPACPYMSLYVPMSRLFISHPHPDPSSGSSVQRHTA